MKLNLLLKFHSVTEPDERYLKIRFCDKVLTYKGVKDLKFKDFGTSLCGAILTVNPFYRRRILKKLDKPYLDYMIVKGVK